MKPEDAAIEMYIDKHGLQGLLTLISMICDEKAEFICANWSDSEEQSRLLVEGR